MEKKSKESYCQILDFLKKIYRESENCELENKNWHSDAELAFTNAISISFPESSIFLCSVHILRNFMKQFKSKVDSNFFRNSNLLRIWRVFSVFSWVLPIL